ncbi:DMT family transporter [Pseudonocardia lacus]|uniref:DMT family transporter n=1 Tax=Pseudonocardia lacus TaxID=2835865 RepID=UPI0020298C5A|nr:DMT family transporter [Pseudonocardia lacus]
MATSPSLSPGIVAAVLAAALLHAAWNAIAHGTPDRLVGFAVMGVTDVVGGGALALVGGFPSAQAWPYVVASAAVHVGYNLLLLAGYQLGEFSQVYPLARGSAPLVVAAFSLLVLHRDLPVLHLAGIVAVSAGLIALVLVGGRPQRAQLPAVAAALATGLAIAGYTVIDGIGVGLGPLLGYIGWMFLLQGPAMPIVAAVRRRGRLVAALRGSTARGLAGGTIAMLAYGIVLWAQTSGALAPIAALRESSIVFGALIGVVFLGERLGGRRAVAAAVVVAGVVALATPSQLI